MGITFNHDTVLLRETVTGLNVKKEGIYVDCTLGGAGHSEYLLAQLDEKGHLYAFDQDQRAIDFAKERLKTYVEKGMVTFIRANFRYLEEELLQRGVQHVEGILYDLGVSSPQLGDAARGFSYHQEARLDMRMDQRTQLSAYEVVNTYPYSELVKIFYRYGEEKFSKPIAREIERTRTTAPIETTQELVEIVKKAIPAPARRKGGHPAKRVFQAIRIAVNDELTVIEESLEQAVRLLAKKGRISVITFHSLEDRIVKNTFKEYSTAKDLPQGIPVIPKEFEPVLKNVTKKPLLPSDEELALNHRSRSAKLRIVEKMKMNEIERG